MRPRWKQHGKRSPNQASLSMTMCCRSIISSSQQSSKAHIFTRSPSFTANMPSQRPKKSKTHKAGTRTNPLPGFLFLFPFYPSLLTLYFKLCPFDIIITQSPTQTKKRRAAQRDARKVRVWPGVLDPKHTDAYCKVHHVSGTADRRLRCVARGDPSARGWWACSGIKVAHWWLVRRRRRAGDFVHVKRPRGV